VSLGLESRVLEPEPQLLFLKRYQIKRFKVVYVRYTHKMLASVQRLYMYIQNGY
jgi:hypothetical protein